MIKAPNVAISILLASCVSFFQVNVQSKPAPTEKLSQCATLLLLKKTIHSIFPHLIIMNQLFLKFKGFFSRFREKNVITSPWEERNKICYLLVELMGLLENICT